jgi:hypothetical protein
MEAGDNVEADREACGTCRFWIDCRCHRYAPRPSTPNELMVRRDDFECGLWNTSATVWPITEEDDWCGDWCNNW